MISESIERIDRTWERDRMRGRVESQGHLFVHLSPESPVGKSFGMFRAARVTRVVAESPYRGRPDNLISNRHATMT
jgi:hypothetical protein